MEILKVKNVMKSFGETKILDNISFDVKEKGIIGIVGLNGVGKTSLIKIILDLLEADSGEVKLFGVSSANHESRKNISYLPEKFMPLNTLTAMEFLSISLSYYGKKIDNKRLEYLRQALAFPKELLTKTIRTYSKGTAQKLGIILQFLIWPKLLILDEPMSGLDPKARKEMKDLLIEYSNAGNSVIFSSHILADIEEICDRILVLSNKKFIYDGSVTEFMRSNPDVSLEEKFLNLLVESAV